MRNRWWRIGLGIFAAGLMSGCVSEMTTVAPRLSDNAQKLGPVEGSSMGALGVMGTAYYFIPMGVNSRIERAYQDALSKAPGATALTNVTIQESWFWFVLGTMRYVTVTGEAVK